jgi:DnaA family protein
LSGLFAQQSSSVVYVYGTQSSGKTHLLQGCAFKALEKSLKVAYIDFKQDMPSRVLDNLEDNDWVCIDNVDSLEEDQQQELFDLYNRASNTSVKLIISGKTLPSELNLFKDLKTRLSLATIFSLETLDDHSKKRIIQQQMDERNLKIDHKIYDYLFKHYSRDLADLLNAINQLDKASLQQKNNITIPLVKQVLDI